MDTRLKRSSLVIGGVAAIALVGGGAAFAYWTTSGGGSGSAAVGSAGAVTIAQTSPITGMFPGGTARTISFTVTNPTTTPLFVDDVVVSIGTIANQHASSGPACVAGDFTLGQPAWTNVDIAPAGTATGTATIAMVNAAYNQDACQGATVNLAFTAS